MVLRATLARLVIRKRSGEIGLLHGMDRFVSTNLWLSKADRTMLAQACKKLALGGGIAEVNK
ncbi:MAG: hypothetical protein Q9M25_10415 [Mariprofundaceae bacterium]|nr:hypothetical protein [Mariprofundaceae bacterium]